MGGGSAGTGESLRKGHPSSSPRRGGDLTAKSISSVGGFIEYFCSGVGTFNFFRQRDWDQDKAWLTGIVFLGFGMAWVSEKVSFFYRCLSATS